MSPSSATVRIVLSVPNKIADKSIISDILQLRPESTNIFQELRYFFYTASQLSLPLLAPFCAI
jgi:hypothetical protein